MLFEMCWAYNTKESITDFTFNFIHILYIKNKIPFFPFFPQLICFLYIYLYMSKKIRVYFTMDSELHKEFLEFIDDNTLSKSKLIERLIKNYIKTTKT